VLAIKVGKAGIPVPVTVYKDFCVGVALKLPKVVCRIPRRAIPGTVAIRLDARGEDVAVAKRCAHGLPLELEISVGEDWARLAAGGVKVEIARRLVIRDFGVDAPAALLTVDEADRLGLVARDDDRGGCGR